MRVLCEYMDELGVTELTIAKRMDFGDLYVERHLGVTLKLAILNTNI